MHKIKEINKLISVRIPDYVDAFIEDLGTKVLGKRATKSDFINEALKTYCWIILKRLESNGFKKEIKATMIDTETGKKQEIPFDEYLEMFKGEW